MTSNLRPGRILEHLVEAWTPVAALSTADTRVAVLLDHLPAPPLGDLAQGGDLVLDGLLVGRYADVNCGALLHNSPQCCQHRITSVYHNHLFVGQAQGPKSAIEGQRFSDLDLEGISVQARS